MRCTCGHLIIDQTDDLPYKGEVFPDRGRERLWDAVASDVEEVVALAGPKERAEWVRKRFGLAHPADLSVAEIVTDCIHARRLGVSRTAFECQECGTLWIQTSPTSQRFQGYSPHEGNARGILDSGGVSGRTG